MQAPTYTHGDWLAFSVDAHQFIRKYVQWWYIQKLQNTKSLSSLCSYFFPRL